MSGCFGCDHANPAGLGMRFFRDSAGRLAASCTPNQTHGGLGRIVNGGLVTTFGEELAAAAAAATSEGGLVVARVEVDYELPTYVGTELRGVVTSTSQEKKVVRVAVHIHSAGKRVAVLNATFVLISEDRLRQLSGIGLDEAPACLVAGRQPLPIED
ncbi:MAG: hotdog fold domain-containing protein [Caldimonas sp.]